MSTTKKTENDGETEAQRAAEKPGKDDVHEQRQPNQQHEGALGGSGEKDGHKEPKLPTRR